MKIYWLIGWSLLLVGYAHGQLRPMEAQSFSLHVSASRSWYSDPQGYFRYRSPGVMISPAASNGSLFWLGSSTTQSFNHGKFGTVYYYDIMGNMQYARTFIDIGGKNRRGIKLLLPTLNQRMFMQR